MINKNESETRALLDALCAWLTEDARFMPAYVNKLRDRFEIALSSRGTFQSNKKSDKS